MLRKSPLTPEKTGKMTLHEAVQVILMSSQEPMYLNEITDTINELGLYYRRDGKDITTAQLTARLARYKALFDVSNNGLVRLPNKSIVYYKEAYKRITELAKESRISSPLANSLAVGLIYSFWRASQVKLNLSSKVELNDLFYLLSSTGELVHQPYVFHELIKILSDIRGSLLPELCQILEMLQEVEILEEVHFSNFISEAISELTFTQGHYYVPAALAKFIGSFYEVGNNGKIFDPFAGNGTLISAAFHKNKERVPFIIGIEQDKNLRLLGALHLLSSGCTDFIYESEDSILYNERLEKIDLVISSPAFGRKVSIPRRAFWDSHPSIPLLTSNSNTVDSVLAALSIGLSALNLSGKMVLIVPDSFLFSTKQDYTIIRQYLVRNHLLKGIISLPKDSFKPFSSVACSVLIIELGKHTDGIFMLDGSSYSMDEFEKKSSYIVSAFRKNVADIYNSGIVNYKALSEGSYNLEPKRHLNDQIFDDSYSSLSELTKYVGTGTGVPKSNLNKTEGIPYIQVGDLPDQEGINEIDQTRANSFVSDPELLSRNPNYIPNDAILIAKVGTKLKPTLYKYTGDALCNPNIIVIATDQERLLPEYLITQLESEEVLKQIETIRHNIGVPHFSKADLLKVRIKVLSLDEQRKFVASFYGKKLQVEQQINAQQREDDLYNVIATLKHEIKQPVSTLGMDINSLQEFLEEKVNTQHPINWTDLTVEALPGQGEEELSSFRLQTIIERMKSAVKEAQSTLSKAEAILNIGSGGFQPEKISLKDFLSKVVKPVFSTANCIINIKGEELEIEGDRYQLELLFKRLIENAIKHGFKKDTPKHTNIINIRLSKRKSFEDYNEIIVENNGAPFPEGFNREQFLSQGLTSNRRGGTGFGGFHTKRIVASHKGEILIATPREIGNSEFKVRFKILLP